MADNTIPTRFGPLPNPEDTAKRLGIVAVLNFVVVILVAFSVLPSAFATGTAMLTLLFALSLSAASNLQRQRRLRGKPGLSQEDREQIEILVERAYANQGLDFDSVRRIGDLLGVSTEGLKP